MNHNVIIDGIEYIPKEKPKPLLIDAKVGCVATLRNGTLAIIIKTDNETIFENESYPILCCNYRSRRLDGRCYTFDSEYDIVSFNSESEPIPKYKIGMG